MELKQTSRDYAGRIEQHGVNLRINDHQAFILAIYIHVEFMPRSIQQPEDRIHGAIQPGFRLQLLARGLGEKSNLVEGRITSGLAAIFGNSQLRFAFVWHGTSQPSSLSKYSGII